MYFVVILFCVCVEYPLWLFFSFRFKYSLLYSDHISFKLPMINLNIIILYSELLTVTSFQ